MCSKHTASLCCSVTRCLCRRTAKSCGLTDHLLLLHEATSEVTAADVLIRKIDNEQRAVYVVV